MLTGRTEVWSVVLRFAGSPWFGTGFDSFWLGDRLQGIWQIFWWHPNEAHNGYLEVFVNLGWVGVALFCAIMVTGYRNVVATFRWDPAAARLKLALVASLAVFNITEAALRTFNPLWVLFLLAVVGVPESPIRAAPSPAAEQPSLTRPTLRSRYA